MPTMTKTRHDNDVTDCTGAIYAKNDIELLWSIRLGVDCDGNYIGQQCDWLYKIDQCQKGNSAIVTDQMWFDLWWK